MTTIAIKIAEGVSCRACGATMAPKHDNKFGLCQHCWTNLELAVGAATGNSFRNRNHGEIITEQHVVQWLANKLEKDVESLLNRGINGRCQAISGWKYGTPGAQCANRAIERRDGFAVCYRHAKATSPQFVGSPFATPYERFSDVIRELCEKDELFAKMICEVASGL